MSTNRLNNETDSTSTTALNTDPTAPFQHRRLTPRQRDAVLLFGDRLARLITVTKVRHRMQQTAHVLSAFNEAIPLSARDAKMDEALQRSIAAMQLSSDSQTDIACRDVLESLETLRDYDTAPVTVDERRAVDMEKKRVKEYNDEIAPLFGAAPSQRDTNDTLGDVIIDALRNMDAKAQRHAKAYGKRDTPPLTEENRTEGQ